MNGRMLGLAIASVLVAGVAGAQTTPVRVRGTVETVQGQELAVKGREGAPHKIQLADDYAVLAVKKATLEDVKPGAFVGIAGLPQPDGSQKAIEVLVFPEAARGTGEGHYPWDLQPESTMTNATIADTVTGVSGPVLTLKYKDGEKKIVVPPEAPIVTFEPGERAMLKPGVSVFVPTQKQPDGTLRAGRVLAGKDGLVPPM